ncbi:uncharacterized protein B0T23DRAFT_142298 [Neurospora hispaniola]|uniref:Uncharacterized protein n=1 Tax=Neurospora hispaniola TaxID=588809 RepID=A0AAJ0I7U1_9PEZI|nr:hypothetical protein B0T23DRAFT_142298 [Neurospora hispaniola]
MEHRTRSWALGLSILGFFALLFSAGFVQQAHANDTEAMGTVIGIVGCPHFPPPPSHPSCWAKHSNNASLTGSRNHLLVSYPCTNSLPDTIINTITPRGIRRLLSTSTTNLRPGFDKRYTLSFGDKETNNLVVALV